MTPAKTVQQVHPEDMALSEEQRAQSQGILKRFFFINGIVVTCVLENILILWSLQNGLSAAHTAVIISFSMLTMPMMMAGKQLSAAIGLARAWSMSWLTRYIFVLAMLPSPWLRNTALAPMAPWLITACVFGLFAMRNIGMVNTMPIIGEATTREDHGSFQAAVTLRGYMSYFLTLGLMIAVLRWRDTPGVFQIILLAGSLLGIYSSLMLRRLPEMPAGRLSARVGIAGVARHILRNLMLRRLALTWCATSTATALIMPIAMLAVKQGYDVPDNTALFFTMLELAGTILAAYALTIIADHTGPRPILLLSMGLYLITTGFWALAPQSFIPGLVGTVFILSGIARGSINMALNHYLLASTGARERLGTSMTMQMLAGTASGLAGSLVAGGLIRYLPSWLPQSGGLALYQTYFRIVLIVCIMAGIVTWRLPRLKNWTVRNVIGLIFSMRDLRTLMTLNALKRDTSDEEDAQRLDSLSQLSSRHSEPVLRDFILHGRFGQQAHAIRALSRIPFSPPTVQALIRLVETGAFINGWRAAELLGQRRISVAVPALRRALTSDDPFLKGKSMVALARIGDQASYPAIRQIFAATDNPRIAIHGAHALEHLRQPEDLRLVLEKTAERSWPTAIADEMILSAAGICNRKTRAYRLLRAPLPETELIAPPVIPPAGPAAHAEGCPGILRDFLGRHPWTGLSAHLRLVIRDCLLAPGTDGSAPDVPSSPATKPVDPE